MVLGKGRVDKESVGLNSQVIEALNEWIAFRSGIYFSPKNGAECDLSMFISFNGKLRESWGIYWMWSVIEFCGVQSVPFKLLV
jgi:hypothetical protein